MSNPRWQQQVKAKELQDAEEKSRNFLKSNHKCQAILRQWANGFEFTNETLKDFCKHVEIVYDIVHSTANKSGVIDETMES